MIAGTVTSFAFLTGNVREHNLYIIQGFQYNMEYDSFGSVIALCSRFDRQLSNNVTIKERLKTITHCEKYIFLKVTFSNILILFS